MDLATYEEKRHAELRARSTADGVPSRKRRNDMSREEIVAARQARKQRKLEHKARRQLAARSGEEPTQEEFAKILDVCNHKHPLLDSFFRNFFRWGQVKGAETMAALMPLLGCRPTKEVIENMAVLMHAKHFARHQLNQPQFARRDDVVALCVGDGKLLRGACLTALFTNWTVYGIDPTAVPHPSHAQVANLRAAPNHVEDFDVEKVCRGRTAVISQFICMLTSMPSGSVARVQKNAFLSVSRAACLTEHISFWDSHRL